MYRQHLSCGKYTESTLLFSDFANPLCFRSQIHATNLNPQTPDFTYDIAEIVIWAAVEVNLAVFSACLPLLRPIYMKIAGKLNLGSSFNNSSGAGVNTGDYQSSRPKSFVRLGGFGGGSSQLGRSKLSGETESTYELAKTSARDAHSTGGVGKHDAHHGRAQVTITGTQLDSDEELQRLDSLHNHPRAGGRNLPTGGIVVRNETSVSITHAQ